MTPRSRAPYRAAIDRPHLALPGGARLALHVIVNVEEWLFDGRMPRTALPPPAGSECVPDVPNYAWYEYGNRVGIWRLFAVLARYGIRATLSINGHVCVAYPRIVEAALAAGWEMMGHGFVQRPMSAVADERAVIRATLDVLEASTGVRPRGWLGPALVETANTLDDLAAEGVEYCCDWGPADDLPYELDVPGHRMLAVPYPVDMNDIVISAIDKHRSDELFTRGVAQFDTLYAESADNATIMALALHPYLTGAPHRIGALDRLLAYIVSHSGIVALRGGEILDWYRLQTGSPSVQPILQ